MFAYLKKTIPSHSPIRLFYHKIRAILAALIYRFPSENMTVIGVTGTNGKTSTCHFLADILMEAGNKVGMLTTSDFRLGDQLIVNDYKMTTLSPFILQKLLRQMVSIGCKYAIVEVTSHALDQSRLWGINVDIALFTNISHDHLDYHGSKNEYLAAKGKLFESINYSKRKPKIPKIVILNGDDPEFPYFEKYIADRSYIYGIKKGSFQAKNLQLAPNGSKFLLKIPNNQIEITFPLPGKFNIENALAAATTAVALEINLAIIQQGLQKAKPVPGRLERIDEGQKYNIIVDYAHAPDSLEKLLVMFRELTPQKLILVFGATGDRDRTKRPIMGEIAAKYADFIILTNDDPYSENPIQIMEEVIKGFSRKEGNKFWRIPDRRQAIRLGLAIAREGDTVIIAGKGCEPYQVVGK